MDQNTTRILELFNILLNELNLPQKIFGYTETLPLPRVLEIFIVLFVAVVSIFWKTLYKKK